MRGREAQQMVQRLRDSRSGRSMSAPNTVTMFTQGAHTNPASGLHVTRRAPRGHAVDSVSMTEPVMQGISETAHTT